MVCVSPTGKTPSNSVLRSTGSSPMPIRERFIGVLVTGAREERRNPEGFLVRLPPARPPPAAMRHAVASSHIKSTPIRTNGSRSRPRTHRARAAHPTATARILTRAASGCGRAVTQWRRPKASKTAARPPPPGGAGAARRARIDGAAVWCAHAARAEGRARQRRAHARRTRRESQHSPIITIVISDVEYRISLLYCPRSGVLFSGALAPAAADLACPMPDLAAGTSPGPTTTTPAERS